MDKRKRNLLLFGGVLLFFGALYRFFPLVGHLLPGDSNIEAKHHQLLQYEKQLEKIQGMKSHLATLKKKLGKVESNLFSGQTPSLAAVEIQNILSEISEKHDARLESFEVLSVKPHEDLPYVEIPVRFIILARVDQLTHILYGIEGNPRYMAVKEALIKPRKVKDGNDGVYAVLTVAGLMKQEEK